MYMYKMYVYYAQVFFLCRVFHSLRARFGGVATTQQTLRGSGGELEKVLSKLLCDCVFFYFSFYVVVVHAAALFREHCAASYRNRGNAGQRRVGDGTRDRCPRL